MLSYYVIYCEKFRKVLQRTEKVALNVLYMKLLLVIYEIYNILGQEYLRNLIEPCMPLASLCSTTDRYMLKMQALDRQRAGISSCMASKLWNSLPLSLRGKDSISNIHKKTPKTAKVKYTLSGLFSCVEHSTYDYCD